MAGINTGDKLQKLNGKERLGGHRESEYLGAEDIEPGTEPIVTIDGLWWGQVTLQRGKESKDVISFAEDRVAGIFNVRPLIVNSTNRKTLRKLYGGVTADILVGKKIQLYVDHNVRDPQTGEKTDGLRIRQFAPQVKEVICESCNRPIVGVGGMTAEQLAKYTKEKYGHCICAECAKKLVAVKDGENETN